MLYKGIEARCNYLLSKLEFEAHVDNSTSFESEQMKRYSLTQASFPSQSASQSRTMQCMAVSIDRSDSASNPASFGNIVPLTEPHCLP